MFCFFYLIFAFVLIKCFAKVTAGRNYSNLCLLGKTALVVGGSSGIGYQVVLDLASRGCKVIIANRSKPNIKEIVDKTANTNISYYSLDLSSLENVRTFVRDIKKSEKNIDFLINNSGNTGLEGYTEDGLQKVMQINYFGQFLLTHLLIDNLQNGRIVFVNSLLNFGHLITKAEDINAPIKTNYFQSVWQYGNSKVCQLIAVGIFAKKLKKYNISVVAVHPGTVDSPFYSKAQGNTTSLLDKLIYIISYGVIFIFGKTVVEGADPILNCALAEDISNGGFYCDNFNFWKPSIIKNEKLCEEIWNESEKLVKLGPEEKLQN